MLRSPYNYKYKMIDFENKKFVFHEYLIYFIHVMLICMIYLYRITIIIYIDPLFNKLNEQEWHWHYILQL